MKKIFTVLSVVSLQLFALVEVLKEIMESYLLALYAVAGNHVITPMIPATSCQLILLGLAAICAALAVLTHLQEKSVGGDLSGKQVTLLFAALVGIAAVALGIWLFCVWF